MSAQPISLQRAQWLAATVGSFNPRDLVASLELPADERRALLARLASACAEIRTGEQVLWTLNADARRRALEEMQRAGMLAAERLPELTAQLALQPLDHFGQHLRAALHGMPSLEVSEHGDVDAQYAAFEFVGRGGVGVAPERAGESAGIVEQRAQRAAVDEQLVQTIGPVFVGRDQELEALRNFVMTGELPRGGQVASTSAGSSGVPLIFVNGIGGAGKSALLAKLVHELRQESSGVGAAVVLDFDRPTLASLDAVELSFEVMRQIALSQPSLAKLLAELRRTALDEFTNAELASSNDMESYRHSARAIYSIHQRLRPQLERVGLCAEPLLIILDSFEEIITLGAAFVAKVYRWLEVLREQVGLKQLRIIVSGRATPADLEPDAEQRAGEVPLGDLRESDAREVLTQRGIDAALAEQLVRVFGSNPLVLRLLGDYASQNGADALQALLNDPEHRERYQAGAAQRVFYSRILDRIRGEDAVRALASPGLVVRIVTPTIIRDVLAEPCGLGQITKTRADELFDELARHVWLVRPIGPRVVAHRRDVRSMMLPFAHYPGRRKGDVRLAAAVKEIHVRALRYYEAPIGVVGSELSAEARRNEAFYHRLFVGAEAALAAASLEALLPAVAADLADFPLEVRARLKQAMGKSLQQDEIDALPESSQQAFLKALESKQLRVIGTPGAGAPADRAGPATNIPHRGASHTRLVTAFAAAEFEEVAEHCPSVLTRMIEDTVRGAKERSRDLAEDVTWLCTFATLACSGGEQLRRHRQWAEQLSQQVLKNWDALVARPLMDKSGLTVAHYLTAVTILLSAGIESKAVTDVAVALDNFCVERYRRPRITSIASLRVFQLFMTVLREPRGMLPTAVQAPCLQYFALLPGWLPKSRSQTCNASLAKNDAVRDAWTTSNQLSEALWKQWRSLTDGPSTTFVDWNSSKLSAMERAVMNLTVDMSSWRLPSWRAIGQLPWPALRGMTPELQSPCLTALRERFHHHKQGEQVLHLLATVSHHWPYDLRPFVADQTAPDSFLTTVGHFADRFAMLSLLFEQAPLESTATRVAGMLTRFDELVARPAGDLPAQPSAQRASKGASSSPKSRQR